ARMAIPGKVETVAPPGHFPITMADKLTRATSISRRNPNSRSRTMEAAEKMAVDSADMDSTPGWTNFLKSAPDVVPGHPHERRGGVREGARDLHRDRLTRAFLAG